MDLFQQAQEHLGQRIIVVAHNIVLRAYLARVLGIPLSQYRRITQENCCVNVLVWQAGEMTVRTYWRVPGNYEAVGVRKDGTEVVLAVSKDEDKVVRYVLEAPLSGWEDIYVRAQ